MAAAPEGGARQNICNGPPRLDTLPTLGTWGRGGYQNASDVPITSVNVPLLHLRSSEGRFTMSCKVEPVRGSLSRCRSCTFIEAAQLAVSVDRKEGLVRFHSRVSISSTCETRAEESPRRANGFILPFLSSPLPRFPRNLSCRTSGTKGGVPRKVVRPNIGQSEGLKDRL